MPVEGVRLGRVQRMRASEAWLKDYQKKQGQPPGQKKAAAPVITQAQARYYTTEAAAWQAYRQAEAAAWHECVGRGEDDAVQDI